MLIKGPARLINAYFFLVKCATLKANPFLKGDIRTAPGAANTIAPGIKAVTKPNNSPKDHILYSASNP